MLYNLTVIIHQPHHEYNNQTSSVIISIDMPHLIRPLITSCKLKVTISPI